MNTGPMHFRGNTVRWPAGVGISLLAMVLAACATDLTGPPAAEPAAAPAPETTSVPGSGVQPVPSEPPPAVTPGPATTRTGTVPVCAPAPAPKPKPRPRRKPIVEEVVPSRPAPVPPPSDSANRAEAGQATIRSLPSGSVLAVLGKKVWGPNGDDLGRVIDVLIDPASGAIRSAVIDFGGFLGVGNRKIAVDWSLLEFKSAPEGKQVRLLLNRSQVLAAPEYRDSSDRAAEVIAPSNSHP